VQGWRRGLGEEGEEREEREERKTRRVVPGRSTEVTLKEEKSASPPKLRRNPTPEPPVTC
jgi:hypothetical protein